MTRKKFTSTFKTKVVLEALKERMSNQELAQKYDIHPQQISTWKREFMDGVEEVFNKGKTKNKKSKEEEKEDVLLKVIGQQKVEIDFLKNALR